MMNKRKALSLFLALALACALLPTAALAVTVTEVVPCKYDRVEDFKGGMAAVERDDKWGFVDKTGKEVVPCKYSEVGNFSEGLAWVRLKDKYGFIDKTGKEVVLLGKYERVNDFSDGLAAVRLNDKYGFIDKTGKVVIPCKYDSSAWGFSEGLAAVGLKDKYGFIDKTGKVVVPCKYGYVFPFSEGLASVNFGGVGLLGGGKWGFVDKTGKEVIPCQYDSVGSFCEGLMPVNIGCDEYGKGGKWGFVDKTGKEVVPLKYDEEGYFSEGLAAVNIGGKWNDEQKRFEGGKWGYIDRTGKEVIPRKYNDALSFSEGLAAVELNDGYGFIDKTGKEVIPCKYFIRLDGFSDGLKEMDGKGGSGFIDKTGKEVVSCKYDNACEFSEGMAAVELNGKWGFLAIDGYVGLELDEGSGVDYIITDDSGTLTVPTNPTKEGYTFGGWYTDAALITPWNFNDKVVNTLTLYAKWVPVSSTADTTGKSSQVIALNGNTVTLDAYSLTASNGGDVTYVKLRDVAALLENTGAKFNVDWKRGAIYVASKSAYTTKNGTELKAISGADGSYKWNQAPVLFDGTTKALEGIVITDGQGGGHTFFKLRDLGKALGFNVGWAADKGIFVETNKPYDPAN